MVFTLRSVFVALAFLCALGIAPSHSSAQLYSDLSPCIRKASFKSSCEAAGTSCGAPLQSFCCSCEDAWQKRFSFCGNNQPVNIPNPFDPNAPLDDTPTIGGPALVDPSGNCAPGTECFFDPLQPSACGEVNGYLKQRNVVTVVNQQLGPLTVTLSYRTQGGLLKNAVTNTLQSLERRDYDINELGLEPDSYGTVCIRTNAANIGAWFGGINLYKPNERKKAKERYDFALYYPFTNPINGVTYVPLSTEKRGISKKYTVANWVRVTDGVAGDNIPLSGIIQYFSKSGVLLSQDRVVIPDGGRFDFGGHGAIGTAKNKPAIGLARFTPDTRQDGKPLSYYLTAARYYYECAGNCNNFISAMSIPIRRPSSLQTVTGVERPVDSKRRNDSVLEVANVGDTANLLPLALYNDSGKKVGTSNVKLAAKASSNVTLSNLKPFKIKPKTKPLSGATSFSPSQIVTARTIYRYNDKNQLLMAYATPPVSSNGEVQIAQFNSQFGQKNTAIVHNQNAFPVAVTLNAMGNPGESLLFKSLTLKANETKRISLSLPKERLGLLIVQATKGTALTKGVVVHNIVSRGDEYALVYTAE